MGMDPEARLAYGYDLGTYEDFKADQRGEFGSPDLPWLDEDDTDFAAHAYNQLFTAVPNPPQVEYDFERERSAQAHFGVEFDHSGAHDMPGFILAAAGSTSGVEWSDTMMLDLADLGERPGVNGWDAKLAAALEALGITSTQAGPRWLVFPFYG